MFDWLTASWESIARIVASAVVIFIWLLVSVRITGLRTFSKMASTDFAVTIASGAVLATTITSPTTTVVQGAVALAALFAIQAGVAVVRRWPRLSTVIENAPLLLMDGEEILHDNLSTARMSVGDLKSKLREANVVRRDQVLAVVLETTGDVTVLHGEPPLDLDLFDGVIGAERLER